MQFPQKCEGKELKILVQPETQHRARYLTEGSRGSVKDRTQQSFPTVKVTREFQICVYEFKICCIWSHRNSGIKGQHCPVRLRVTVFVSLET